MRYVANLLRRNHSIICRMVKRFNQTESYNRSPGQGRKWSTDPRDGRFLRQSALRNRTGTMLKNELAIARSVMISSRTVRRCLNEGRLSSRRPEKKALLTREHRITRFHFARNHQNWTVDDWKRI